MELHVSEDKLKEFSELFWRVAAGAKIFLFHGELGAGKTTIIAALCRAKGVRDSVSSPTFSIINEYAYEEHGVLKKLYHMDLYRLQSEDEVVQAGVEDCLLSGAVCFVEWPQKALRLFDETAVEIFIETASETERLVKFSGLKTHANKRTDEQA